MFRQNILVCLQEKEAVVSKREVADIISLPYAYCGGSLTVIHVLRNANMFLRIQRLDTVKYCLMTNLIYQKYTIYE